MTAEKSTSESCRPGQSDLVFRRDSSVLDRVKVAFSFSVFIDRNHALMKDVL